MDFSKSAAVETPLQANSQAYRKVFKGYKQKKQNSKK
jgi:hypothetical protein